MKVTITSILTLFIFAAFGQLNHQTASQGYFFDDSDTLESTGIGNTPGLEAAMKKKIQLNVSFGTTFATSFGSGNYFGAFISPHISYPLSNRFTLRTGGIFTNSFSNSIYETYPARHTNYYFGSLNRSFIYAEGAYQLNENITLTGTVYKELDLTRNPGSKANENQFDNSGLIMGVDYKLGKNVFIRGQIEISNGTSPYYSPFDYPQNQSAASSFQRSLMDW
ncbi:MAG: hypothetical protein K8S16_15520 [Bacteroidales bacterium]|nr:hypothetical protein [Bacteroidales bacterium]